MTRKETMNKLFKLHGLLSEDVHHHQHYTIITRSGIDKLQASIGININYDVIKCEPKFAVIKANASLGDVKLQTFASALKGTNFKDGSTNSWYVMEIAEKRAMSRAVLKLAGLYQLKVFAEDESEQFKIKKN